VKLSVTLKVNVFFQVPPQPVRSESQNLRPRNLHPCMPAVRGNVMPPVPGFNPTFQLPVNRPPYHPPFEHGVPRFRPAPPDLGFRPPEQGFRQYLQSHNASMSQPTSRYLCPPCVIPPFEPPRPSIAACSDSYMFSQMYRQPVSRQPLFPSQYPLSDTADFFHQPHSLPHVSALNPPVVSTAVPVAVQSSNGSVGNEQAAPPVRAAVESCAISETAQAQSQSSVYSDSGQKVGIFSPKISDAKCDTSSSSSAVREKSRSRERWRRRSRSPLHSRTLQRFRGRQDVRSDKQHVSRFEKRYKFDVVTSYTVTCDRLFKCYNPTQDVNVNVIVNLYSALSH